jgi:hypothetical protein
MNRGIIEKGSSVSSSSVSPITILIKSNQAGISIGNSWTSTPNTFQLHGISKEKIDAVSWVFPIGWASETSLNRGQRMTGGSDDGKIQKPAKSKSIATPGVFCESTIDVIVVKNIILN